MKFFKKLLKALAALVLVATAFFIYSGFIEPNMLVTTAVKKKIPAETLPFKVVLFSDTHFGKHYSQKNVEKIVKKINEQNPDIVVFGGDFFDNYARDKEELDLDYLAEELRKITAKHGKYAVFGNHDHGGGAVRVYEQFMTDSGFEVLRNESISIDELNINIIGLDDFRLGRVDRSLYSIDNSRFNLIIAHQPDVIDLMEIKGSNLMLSGHSHGGQVSLPFITDRILPSGAKHYIKGLYSFDSEKIDAETNLFVTKGIGMTTLPLRFLNPPEIAVIDFS